MGKVQGIGVYEGVEAVAGDAADHLRVATLYLFGVSVSYVEGAPDQTRLRIGVAGPLHSFPAGHGLKFHHFAASAMMHRRERIWSRVVP